MVQKKRFKIKRIDYFSFSGNLTLKGFVRNGFDSSIMINWIVCFDSKFDEFKKKGFTFPPNLFYYHEISRSEVIGVLINEFNFTKKEAIDALNKIIKEFNLIKLRREASDKNYETIVKDANEVIVKKEKNANLRIGEQDIIIIGSFLKNQINIIHACDKGFEKTCNELKLNVLPIPKRDKEREKEIKNWLKNKSK